MAVNQNNFANRAILALHRLKSSRSKHEKKKNRFALVALRLGVGLENMSRLYQDWLTNRTNNHLGACPGARERDIITVFLLGTRLSSATRLKLIH